MQAVIRCHLVLGISFLNGRELQAPPVWQRKIPVNGASKQVKNARGACPNQSNSQLQSVQPRTFVFDPASSLHAIRHTLDHARGCPRSVGLHRYHCGRQFDPTGRVRALLACGLALNCVLGGDQPHLPAPSGPVRCSNTKAARPSGQHGRRRGGKGGGRLPAFRPVCAAAGKPLPRLNQVQCAVKGAFTPP